MTLNMISALNVCGRSRVSAQRKWSSSSSELEMLDKVLSADRGKVCAFHIWSEQTTSRIAVRFLQFGVVCNARTCIQYICMRNCINAKHCRNVLHTDDSEGMKGYEGVKVNKERRIFSTSHYQVTQTKDWFSPIVLFIKWRNFNALLPKYSSLHLTLKWSKWSVGVVAITRSLFQRFKMMKTSLRAAVKAHSKQQKAPWDLPHSLLPCNNLCNKNDITY